MDKNKKGNLRITCFIAFFFIFIILWFVFSYLNENLHFTFFTPLTCNILLALSITSLIFVVFLTIRYDSLFKELNRSLELINNINNDKGLMESEIKTSFPVVSDINRAIHEISMDIRRQVKELNDQIKETNQIDSRLKDAYEQLDASYAQLQVLMEKLNESEQRYHSLVINIPDIVLTLDSHGNITYANRACRDILKFRRHEIEGRPFQYIVEESYAYAFNYEKLRQTVEVRGEQLMQIPLRKKDGSFIQAEIKFTPVLESPQGISLQAIIRDVTEQKRMENILVENNRRLEIMNNFSQKIASAVELPDIYKICVNTLTEALGFYGAMYLKGDKKEKCYRIEEYSGKYFSKPDILKYFLRINRKLCSFSKGKDGILLDFNQFAELLVAGQGSIVNIPYFESAYIQALKTGLTGPGFLLVISDKGFKPKEFDLFRSIGNTAAVAIENAMHLIKSKDYYVATIDALIAAVEARDQYTRGHSQRVSAYAVKIAEEMGMSKEQIEDLRIAGILHDIGKIGISDSILLKKGPLTKEEYEEIKKHPAISNKILYPIGLSDRILKAIAFHHERFDGRGYPFGLSNESLGLEPQIIAVADAFDAMTSKRPYREPLSIDEALRELERNKRSQFHPDIVDVMIKIQSGIKSLV